MNYEIENEFENIVNIKVVGIGGGGNNAINRMIQNNAKGVEFVAINTDKQVVNYSPADKKIQVGQKLTKGQGAGANPEVGRKAAEESKAEIAECLEGADMVFVAAGMGGGTGTGGAPVVAEIAKQMGMLTVGVVTKPFSFEGKHRAEQAKLGIEELSKHVDSLIIVPNDKLSSVSEEKITIRNAFAIADSVLIKAVASITDLITQTGFINVDFADIKTVMEDAGIAHMGIGHGKNPIEAARNAIESPLLETSISGAEKIILNFTTSDDVGFDELEEAAEKVKEQLHDNAQVIFGADMREDLENPVQVIVIATGFGENKPSFNAAKTNVAGNVNDSNREPDDFDIIQNMFNKKRFPNT